MSTPAKAKDADSGRVVSYGTDDFERAVGQIEEALRSGEGLTFLLIGASEEEKQEALAKLSAPGELNMHRFKVPNLVEERLNETQGNLREAFDTADESAALLFFDDAGVLLDRAADRTESVPQTEEQEKQDADDDAESEAMSDYFFDRVEAYPGVAVVCFSGPQYVRRLEGHSADYVVEF